MVRIKQILKNCRSDVALSVGGFRDVDITGITENSTLVAPGFLFVARRGGSFDGNAFVPEAIASGAVCILSDVVDPSLPVPQILSPDVARAEAALADAFWHHPSKDLFVVGVTGTSGKTTTSYLIRHLFHHFGVPSGLIGTVSYIAGDRQCAASRTTPDAISNHRFLREVVRTGGRACVMEVSSHALDQNRVFAIEFDTAVFTNLTHEHLDYHGTLEAYGRAKEQLFRQLESSTKQQPLAVLNAQDPWVHRLSLSCPKVLYAVEGEADVSASALVLKQKYTEFSLCYQGQSVAVRLPLIGRFNVANALAAASAFLARGYPLDGVAQGLSTAVPPPGRLERVSNPLGLAIYVDYAHKEDALRKVLPALRESTPGRIITVFGCGGDRDREKRPKMGRAVESLSDVAIVTSDNPRSERPDAIIQEICTGFQVSQPIVLPDRREAIQRAVDMATPDDTILIAGKGHEKEQVFAHASVPFDDCRVAAICCGERLRREQVC